MKKEKIVVIFYIALALLWAVTTVLQIMDDDAQLWIIIVDVVILTLSTITAVLRYRDYKKNK